MRTNEGDVYSSGHREEDSLRVSGEPLKRLMASLEAIHQVTDNRVSAVWEVGLQRS